MQNLTLKQERFADEYLVDLNGTQAAIRAGYSPHTARITAAKLLAKSSVRFAVDAAMRQRSERTRMDQDSLVAGLLREAHGDGPDTSTSARVRAWELLGKHLGMFADRVQHEGNEQKPIQFIEIVRTGDTQRGDED